MPDRFFNKKGNIIKFGIEPVRVNLINEIDGVEFEEISQRTIRGRYGEVEVTFICKEDLIRNKEASGRSQDVADLEKLRS